MITEDILEWVATLPKWQQKLSYVLVEKKKVTEEELEEIYEIFKVEMSLAEGDISNYDIQEQTYENEDSHDIKWRSVGNIHGVNKLKTGPVLNVSDGLTVVYGENGSGKSGYCPQSIPIREKLEEADKALRPLPYKVGINIARKFMFRARKEKKA